MKKRQIILGGILVIVVAAALALAFRIGIWVERNTPTKEVMSLGRYYEAEEDEVVILLDAERSQVLYFGRAERADCSGLASGF